MIELRNLEKSYPLAAGRVYVLRNISLSIAEGEFVSIMGPSGAGKSTLLHILGMHDGDFTGEYEFRAEIVNKLKPRDRQELQKRNIGFVFQSFHLLDDLTVYENLELPLSYRDRKKGERQAIVADVLDKFNIVGKKDLYPSQLSGGQQQLVGVARAIVAKPCAIVTAVDGFKVRGSYVLRSRLYRSAHVPSPRKAQSRSDRCCLSRGISVWAAKTISASDVTGPRLGATPVRIQALRF